MGTFGGDSKLLESFKLFFLTMIFKAKPCSRQFNLELTPHSNLVSERVVGSGGCIINKSRFLKKESGEIFSPTAKISNPSSVQLPSGNFIKLWKITIFHGTNHYFYGHFQCKSFPEGTSQSGYTQHANAGSVKLAEVDPSVPQHLSASLRSGTVAG